MCRGEGYILKKQTLWFLFMDTIDICLDFVPVLSCRLQMYAIWCYEKLFYLIESFCSGKRLRIVLKHKSSSKCAKNLLSNIICFE